MFKKAGSESIELGLEEMAKKRRKQSGPMTAAGLIAFYEEYEGKVKISPTTLVLLAAAFTVIVAIAHLFG